LPSTSGKDGVAGPAGYAGLRRHFSAIDRNPIAVWHGSAVTAGITGFRGSISFVMMR